MFSPWYIQTPYVIWTLIFLLPTICFSKVTEDDFYAFQAHQKLTTNYKQVNTLYEFPHWSDNLNTRIDIVESGIIRLSGFEGINTLDILVLATAQPIDHGGGIYYQEYRIPSQSMKNDIKKEIKEGTNIDDGGFFNPISVFIATWNNVEFYSGKKSSFQVLLATNGTKTITIIKVAKMTIPTWKLNFYPELDTRFAYEDGTKFKRSRFLKTAGSGKTIEGFEVKSGNQYSHQAAVSYSNSLKEGRWIIDITRHPDADTLVSNKTTSLPDGVKPPSVEETNIGVGGKFVFETVTLDGSQITKPGDNNEVSVILSKKNKDSRYTTLDTNVKEWLNTVFSKASNATPEQITIIAYKAGSLVVEYSVEIPKDACNDKTRTECIGEVESGVRTTTKNNPVTTENMQGSLDESKTEFLDIDECSIDSERTDKIFCDTNAYCVEYPGQGSYACICKDGFDGNGKVGNCKKQKNKAGQFIPVIGGVGGAAILLLVIFSAVIWYVKKTEKKRLRNRLTEAQRIIPKNMLPKNRKVTMKEKPGRSTRKIMLPARYAEEEFDIYHRT